MTIDDLNRNQLIELKERYMLQLAIEGTYPEIMNSDYPTMDDIANADKLIPDDIILEKYEYTVFSEDDFNCAA